MMSDANLLKPIDVTGPTLEEAIESGLAQLGLNRNDVIIEIIEEGSRGMLGLGARQARVRLTPLRSNAPPTPPTAPISTASPKRTPAPKVSDESEFEGHAMTEGEAGLAKDVLQELLGHMSIDADIEVRRAESAAAEGEPPWVLDIQGQDLGILIGRHGETLDALQYITRLIVSHELQGRANIVLDVEGYKTRREGALRKLAFTMAAQARQMGRTMTLEPMPPNERRIIHITLREDDTVTTESVGTGDQRRVTIIPRKK
jgi:spoIIIJ-associated protein